MKKHLLLMAGAMVAATGAFAQQPAEYPNTFLSAMSANGKYAAGENMITQGIDVLDVTSGNIESYYDETFDLIYTIGTGTNPVSDTGIVLICTTYEGTASYIENGELKHLPLPEKISSAFCNAITPDGSRIAGMIGVPMSLDYNGIMQVPCVWTRNADGTYGMPELLPHPATDFSGRAPQYILVDGISADGTVIACEVWDYYGSMGEPMIITERDGEWSYTTFGRDLIVPEGIEFPEYPGEKPSRKDFISEEGYQAYLAAVELGESMIQPEPVDFMTPEEREAFEAAMEAYMEDYFNNPYPYYADYMTEEEDEAYDAAMAEYYKYQWVDIADYMTPEEEEAYLEVYRAWEEKNDAFAEAYEEVQNYGITFDMNSLTINREGTLYAITGSKKELRTVLEYDWWDDEYYEVEDLVDCFSIYIFNLSTGRHITKSYNEAYIIPTNLTAEGLLYAVKPANWMDPASDSFVTTAYGAPLMPLKDYITAKNADTYAWMEENMRHISWEWDDELFEDVEVETFVIGQGACSADMSVFVTWAQNSWDPYDDENISYSYILPVSEASGIGAIAADDAQGEAVYYNLQGIRVDNPAQGTVVIRVQGDKAAKIVK